MNYRIIFILFFSSLQLSSYAFLQTERTYNEKYNLKETVLSENESIPNSQDVKSSNNSNTVSGSVFAGTNLLPEGQIYLLNYNKSTFSSVKSNSIVNGNFKFENINTGQYILYVIPEFNYDFLYFPKYLPTYYGKSYSWQKSLSSNISKGNLNLNINLLSYQKPFCGDKIISGQLKFNKMFGGINNLPIPVILLNKDGIPMDFRIADKHSGRFVFEYLPEGVYYIHPEIPGLKTTDFRIHINNNNYNQSNEYNINFLVDEENIEIEEQSDDIVPVLSDNFLKVFLKENINYPVVCELIDLSGKIITKKVFYSDEISINTSGMAANLYVLKVRTYDNSPIKTAKVFIRNY